MTLQEIIDLGYTSITAKVSGYQEAGIFGCWQPFKTIRDIVFKINPDIMILEHRTFWINNEETLDYIVEDDKAILYEPDVFARADY